MSFNKHYRQAWITKTYARLADLARQCANTAFAEHVDTIVGDRETTARGFMKHCRDNFGTEVAAALAEQAQSDIEKQQVAETGAKAN